MSNVSKAYEIAKEVYAEIGVDTDQALEKLKSIKISLNCWQGDDLNGFLFQEQSQNGGIQATGNYPGKARNCAELRQDVEKALSMIPGNHKLSLHATYTDTEEKVDLDTLEPRHFDSWIQWAKEKGVGLDFNATCFSHPMADSGFTISSADPAIRAFWIEHCKISRKIAEHMGKELNERCVTNFWFPDGYKDIPVDRVGPRMRMKTALDEVFSLPIDSRYNLDAVESKLFGIGKESYTVGSNEFCLGYAAQNHVALTLDAGHFHPTEGISDKIPTVLLFVDELLLHVSRPVRWDSDHVVLLDDETQAIASEIVRHDLFDRVHIGLDFFDASINRIAAWVIGTRNMKKALLRALLEPTAELRKLEAAGDYTARLALLEEQKSLPWQAVWEMYCQRHDTPAGSEWLESVRAYEKEILSRRG